MRCLRDLGMATYEPPPEESYSVANKMHQRIAQRDGRGCRRCGQLSRRRRLSVDHVIPRSRGGPHATWNRVLLCRHCNSKKRHQLVCELILDAVERWGAR